jgi:hypothetical protein
LLFTADAFGGAELLGFFEMQAVRCLEMERVGEITQARRPEVIRAAALLQARLLNLPNAAFVCATV